jgi:hypothetical protein
MIQTFAEEGSFSTLDIFANYGSFFNFAPNTPADFYFVLIDLQTQIFVQTLNIMYTMPIDHYFTVPNVCPTFTLVDLQW